MNLIHQRVIHEIWGIGEVCSFKLSYIRVDFDGTIKTFKYPKSFMEYIRFEDPAVQQLIHAEVRSIYFKRLHMHKQNMYHVVNVHADGHQTTAIAFYW